DVNKGLLFDGRLNEDFKLANGTWVSVGPLRAKFLGHFAPLVRDVVIAGHDRDFIAALIFPDSSACAELCVDCAAGATPAVVLRNNAVRAEFQSRLEQFAAESTGSSNRIVRAILCEEAPSLDAGEITDKGSFNQGNVLDRRAALVEQLYLAEPPLHVLRI
ncbi:MAG: hypothetical protein WA867_10230, partial [Candidatus Acidiferrales bacterium]